MGLKAGSVGLVSLCMNRDVSDKAERYTIAGGDGHNDVMEWLNSKSHNLVFMSTLGA